MRRLFYSIALILGVAPPLALRGQSVETPPKGLTVPALVARVLDKRYRELDDRRLGLEKEMQNLPFPVQNERGARLGWKVFGYRDALVDEQWVEIDLGATHRIDSVCLVPVDTPTTDSDNTSAQGFPLRFRILMDDGNGAWRVMADRTERDFPSPGAFPVLIRTPDAAARRVRVTMSKPWSRGLYRAYALGEVLVLQGNRNLATGLTGVKVQTSGSFESAPAWSRQNLIDGQSILGAPVRPGPHVLTHGWESEHFADPATKTWVQVDLGKSQPFDEVRLWPARLTDYSYTRGYGFPLRFKVEVSDDGTFATARVLGDWTNWPFGDSGFSPLTIPGDGQPARYVRVTAHELWQRSQDTYTFALGELQVYQGDRNIAATAAVTASSSFKGNSANFSKTALTDGRRGMLDIAEWPEWLGGLSRRRELQQAQQRIEQRLAMLQPELRRTVAWIFVSVMGFTVSVTVVFWMRSRHRQTRTITALQRRIAGDLHDEIGSNLANIAMLAELGQRQPPEQAREDIAEISRLASESAAAMRDIVWLTQPGPHDAQQLSARLEAAAQRLLKGVEWKFSADGLTGAPSLDVQRHLLLSLKEMLGNVLHHAAAKHVEIRLAVRDERFTLEVRDDGRGFALGSQNDGHGLTSLRHRAKVMGGELTVASRPGEGTRVALSGYLHPRPASIASSS